MLYSAIFLLSLSSLSFEVMLTRFFLISQWNHLSFMVISIALLGYAASGRFSHRLGFRLKSGLGRLPQSSEILIELLLLMYSIVSFSSYFFLNLIPMDFFRIMVERVQFFYLAATYLILSVPFFITGLTISMAYSLNPKDSGKIYLINMTASALGAVLPFLLLGIIGEGKMVMGSALLPVVGLFIKPGNKNKQIIYKCSFKFRFPKRLIEIGGILTLATALIAFSAWHDKLSVFRVSPYKTLSQLLKFPDTRVIRRIVNIRERVDLLKSPYVRFAPGLSLKYGEAIIGKEAVVLNGDTVVSLYSMEGIKDFPRYTLSFAGYILENNRRNHASRVLVIENGGGFAIPAAAAGGAKRIDVLVNSKGLYETLSEHYGIIRSNGITAPYEMSEISGELKSKHAGKTGIRIMLKNPRAFIQASAGKLPAHGLSIKERYDLIQIENWGSSIPGMASSNEEPLFTVDAFTSYLRILSRTGILIISRKLLLPPSDSLRLFLTAIESLVRENRNGIKTLYYEAANHIAVMRNWDTFTMLVSKEPLSGNDISLLKDFAERMNFDFIYYPGIKKEEANRFNVYNEPYFYNDFKKFLDASKNYNKLLNRYYLDIKPQYDNRPFENRFIRLSGISDYFKATGSRPYKLLMSGEVVVIAVFAEALLLSLFILFIPGEKGSFLPYLYFFFVGSGFMFIEMGLIKIFTMVTGNPVVSFTMTLSVILVFSGLGGKVSDWIKKPEIFILLLIAQVFLLFLGYFGILHYLLSLSRFWRFALSIVLLIPISFLIGFPFPVGMRCTVTSPGQRSYAWAVNGVSSVLIAVISEYIASAMGIDILILAGIVSYLVVFSLLYLILTGRRISPPC